MKGRILRRKLAITLAGLAGTFLVNIARLLVIFFSAYQWVINAGLAIHAYLCYGLFIVWVLVYWMIAFRYASPPIMAPKGIPQEKGMFGQGAAAAHIPVEYLNMVMSGSCV